MAEGLTEVDDLVVEDGTIVAGANSYNTLAAITAYATLRQDTYALAWLEADESNQVAAAIIATDFMDKRWCFTSTITDVGTDVLAAQDLEWPRFSQYDSRGVLIDDDEIPEWITDAHSEYAVRAIDTTTFLAKALQVDLVTQDESGRFIKETFEQVGPLREQIKYSDSKATRKTPDYGNADNILRNSGLVVLGAGSMAIRG
ncbi:unnamed protein product [marine sediment metagenome]|uniref:Putative DnaT-like domain-containing protein n=1 Tax=marine sediment metagenome TaxID=412755 RepID=X0S319_9ZZZZ